MLADGRTSFQALPNMRSLPLGARLTYFVFDLLYLDVRDIGQQPFEKRKALLQAILDAPASSALPIHYVPAASRGARHVQPRDIAQHFTFIARCTALQSMFNRVREFKKLIQAGRRLAR
jgi:hypothetical protein